MSGTITITMSEVVTYSRTFKIGELARLLAVEATEGAVRSALDIGNNDYGTANENDESLLNAMIPPDNPVKYLDAVEDREWGIQ